LIALACIAPPSSKPRHNFDHNLQRGGIPSV
jgi:hypothetical protein